WEEVQTTTVWNLRLIPFWYLSVYLLMGLGAAEVVRGVGWLARWFTREMQTPVEDDQPDEPSTVSFQGVEHRVTDVESDTERRTQNQSLARKLTIAALTVVLAIGVLAWLNGQKNDG